MPNITRKPGAAKAAGRAKRGGRVQPMQVSLGRKAPPSRKRNPMEEDEILNPDEEYAEEAAAPEKAAPVEIAEPFSDGLVSARLRGLTVIPRRGGEDTSTLHDFLELFSKTETFIGAISSKTSFMKKTGGRLL